MSDRTYWVDRYGKRAAFFMDRIMDATEYLIRRTRKRGPFVFKLGPRNYLEYAHLQKVITDSQDYYGHIGFGLAYLNLPIGCVYIFDKRDTP